jgi:alkylation response protein AidB-like acyl-CoA dehydrogenase
MSDEYGVDEAAGRWRQAAAALATECLAPHAAEVDAQARFPMEGMTALARSGFYGFCLDSQVGGQGQGPATFGRWSENSRGSAPPRRWSTSCT